jgi:adhesin/invasin
LAVKLGLGSGAAGGTFSAVTDNGNGTYTATFTGTIAGANTIRATIGGQAVSSPPLSVTVVPGAVSLSKSTIAVSASQVTSGNSVTVTLVARDTNGNQELSGGLAVKFGLGSGNAGGTFGTITDHKNGTYTVTFTATTAGSNTITATIGGQAVSSTLPTVTVVPGPVSLSKSTITLLATQVASGNSTMVMLVARDANGNQELSGGLTVAFGLGTGTARGTFGTVTDNGNGTYAVTFTGSTAGSNTITVSIGGQKVSSTPPAVIVPSVSHSVAAHDAAMMAVLADLDDGTDVTGAKTRLAVSGF